MSKVKMMELLRSWGTVFLFAVLPWQTRYIFWQPSVGEGISEFGHISVYVAALLAWFMAGLWFFQEQKNKRYIGMIFLGGVLGAILFFLTYPSVTHGWVLQGVSACAAGYAMYCLEKEKKGWGKVAICAGLLPPLMLGAFQVITGEMGASTWLGLAQRNAEHRGDAVITILGERVLRMYGSFPHPNIFGTALALMGGVVLALKKGIPKKIFIIGMVCVIVVGVCISRSAALAMALALCAKWLHEREKVKIVPWLMLVPLSVWCMQFIAPSILHVRGSGPEEQRSIEERREQINEWKMVVYAHPLMGAGIYGYPQALAQEGGSGGPAWKYQPVHQVWMLIAGEIGILGVGFLCVGGYVLIKRSKEKTKKQYVAFLSSPVWIVLWSLSWFDHALWTSWSGMAYTSVAIGMYISSLDS